MEDWALEKILIEVFIVCMILVLAGLIFGPLGYEIISIAFSVAACLLALGGIMVVFFYRSKQ